MANRIGQTVTHPEIDDGDTTGWGLHDSDNTYLMLLQPTWNQDYGGWNQYRQFRDASSLYPQAATQNGLDGYFMKVGTGILGMFIMLLVGLPTYICATASVPIALALHMKGFSMGALIVFLMSGPATNVATISVAIKQLGKKTTIIYISSIVICSMAAGIIFDNLFPGLRVEDALVPTMNMLPYEVKIISAIILLMILGLINKRKEYESLQDTV